MFPELTKKEGKAPERVRKSHRRSASPSNPAFQRKTTEKIEAVVTPILQSLGLSLFEVQFSGGMKGGHLKIFIDKATDVTVDDCAQASRYLGHALEIGDDLPKDYTLEVSSPGINRPLRTQNDFRRFIGKRIRIKTGTQTTAEKRSTLIGRLIDFKAEHLFLVLNDGSEKEIPFDQIQKARLEIEPAFGRSKGGLKK